MLSSWSLAPSLIKRCVGTFSLPLSVQFTDILCAEPLKKKKRISPAIIKQREDRKRRRIEKHIRRLERNEQQLKMISECEVPSEILYTPHLHCRNIRQSCNVDSVILATKEWSRYRLRQNSKDKFMVDRILESHLKALYNLKLESPVLYNAAIKADADFIPWKASGPVETPPILEYDSPDGEYYDISTKWED